MYGVINAALAALPAAAAIGSMNVVAENQSHIGKIAPIGCFPLGNAINGASDLKGNIIEWLSTGYGSDNHEVALADCHPENHVLLSDGTFLRRKELLQCGSRDWFCPIDWFSSIVGFRVCLIADDGRVNSIFSR